jgi:hypothetical protein
MTNFFKKWVKKPDIDQFKDLKFLFVLKRREDYSSQITNGNYSSVATGMWNSSRFIVEMLNSLHIFAKQVMVTDNNDIDREVTDFGATHVFIEGLWVVPEKFDVLKPLHPNVKWIIRVHSETPFLSQEGIAMGWIAEYWERGIIVAPNSYRMHHELEQYYKGAIDFNEDPEFYPLLTNFYPIEDVRKCFDYKIGNSIHIGCFGAIRPLKNQLIQAMSAFEYASKVNKKLYFHINSNRIEGNAGSTLKNLREYFSHLNNAELVEHPWTSHEQFLQIMSDMDLLLQVSFSETFNIVSADAIKRGIPIVGSDEIPFLAYGIADPTSSEDIVRTIKLVLNNRKRSGKINAQSLLQYSNETKDIWLKYAKSQIK